MKTLICTSILLASLASGIAQSSFTVSLDAAQAGGGARAGVGSGSVTLNPDNTVTYDILFSGLSGNSTIAHIHGPGAPGVSAGVVQGLTITTGMGAPSGSLVGTTGVLNTTQVGQMMSDLYYVNIHSSTFGGGEIRGQLLLVPEPATGALLGLGAVGLLFWRRRK